MLLFWVANARLECSKGTSANSTTPTWLKTTLSPAGETVTAVAAAFLSSDVYAVYYDSASGYLKLFHSTDEGATWPSAGTDVGSLTYTGSDQIGSNLVIRTVGGSDVAVVAWDSSGVHCFYSTDKGASWSSRSSLDLQNYPGYIDFFAEGKSLYLLYPSLTDETSGRREYLCLLRSDDYGVTWY